jgi:hypothetical protein
MFSKSKVVFLLFLLILLPAKKDNKKALGDALPPKANQAPQQSAILRHPSLIQQSARARNLLSSWSLSSPLSV